jgi:hypothetical protein
VDLKIFQIYFAEAQKGILDYKPYLNADCTPFFENSVIADLVGQGAHRGSDYFGVVSHSLREKVNAMRTGWRVHPDIAGVSPEDFSVERFAHRLDAVRPDAMSFQRHVPHDPVATADRFHPNFSAYFAAILGRIGYQWKPTTFEHVFYCNYFVAKADIYQRYVTEMLVPAMSIMRTMPELMGHAGYPHGLPQDLQVKFGVAHYPYHPFLCERFFSYFAHLHGLRCAHY